MVNNDELSSLSMAHLDCDAFYASVEKRDRPELRDMPVIVGGGVRGVVTTCCYIARISGVRSAMPMFKARKLCPQAVIIKPDFAKYKEASRYIMEKLRALTPLVQPLSLDEAWLDLSGTERLNGGPPAWQLARAQKQIEAEIGLSVSVGLAPNKFLAKIASDLDKPRGFAVIGTGDAMGLLATKPVSSLPGVGPAFAKSLEKAGLSTVGAIAAADPRDLVSRFGDYGLHLHNLAHARDSRRVNPEQVRKSISCENTFNTDLISAEDLEDELWPLCDRVARQVRAAGIAGRTATLKLRRPDFQIVTRRRTLPIPCQTAKALFAVMRDLMMSELGQPYRLIGAGLADFVEAEAGNDLFGQAEAKALKSEKAVDALRDRFGKDAILSGRALKSRPPPG
jgi:DNA polymerase-4